MSHGEILDATLWRARLAPYEAELQESYGTRWTWVTGGCFAFAEAFQKAFGGEFYGVCRISEEDGVPDLAVDHALVMLDGVLYDHEGPYDLAAIKSDQVLKHRDDDYVCWFEDDFFDDEGWEGIHAVLSECAAEIQGETRSGTPTARPGA